MKDRPPGIRPIRVKRPVITREGPLIGQFPGDPQTGTVTDAEMLDVHRKCLFTGSTGDEVFRTCQNGSDDPSVPWRTDIGIPDLLRLGRCQPVNLLARHLHNVHQRVHEPFRYLIGSRFSRSLQPIGDLAEC